MGDKKTLKALGEAFCKEVNIKIGDKYTTISTNMENLMKHIKQNKDPKTVIDAVNLIEKELQDKRECVPKISERAKNLRAFWDVANQVGKGSTDGGLDKKKTPEPSTNKTNMTPSKAAKCIPSGSQAPANKNIRDGSSPNTTNPEDQSSELKLIAKAAEGLGTAEANKQEDISRLKTENQYLREALEGLHQGIHGGDETALTTSRQPQETKNNPACKELEVKIKDIADKFHVTKTEAEYTFRLLEELNKYSGYEGTQGTADSLPEPPIQHERAGSKQGQRIAKQKHEEKPRSEHDEQLLKSFNTASSVLEKLSEAEYIARLLEELYKYSNYEGKHDTPISLHEPPIQKARAISKDKKREYKKQYDENPYSRHDDQLQKNFEGASSVLEKLMEAEYTARLLEELNKYTTYSGKQDTQSFLTEPPIQLTLPSSKVGKMDAKKQNDENPRWRHVEQLQINFKSASSVLEKLSELDNVYRRISQISTLFSENEGAYVSQSPPKIDKIAATGRKGRSIPFQATDQSQQALQFEKDVDFITITFNYLKDKKS